MKEKPIGYWLREADKAITEKVNEGLGQFGMTRFHWQVLNVVRDEKSATEANMLHVLGRFIDGGQLNELLNDLLERGWAA